MRMESLIFDDVSVLNSKLMEIAQEQQKVTANNMANAETPGYIRRELDFQGRLKQLMSEGNTEAIGDLKPELVLDNSGTVRDDGNNVTISQEMNDMMQNGIYFNLLAKAFATRINILRTAISGS
ncbi:MAG: flagellar basal-body rod protein FlgB [Lentisphaerae bacterium GWF2_45_14]|nr:MAG: flagellar basal-body rod protein FlgB [Lentisphaerae bacterium GWF2_45_14]